MVPALPTQRSRSWSRSRSRSRSQSCRHRWQIFIVYSPLLFLWGGDHAEALHPAPLHREIPHPIPRPQIVRLCAVAPAAAHFEHPVSRAGWVCGWRVLVIVTVVPVRRPLFHVSVAVVQAPRVRRECTDAQEAIEIRFRYQIAGAALRANLVSWKIDQNQENLPEDRPE